MPRNAFRRSECNTRRRSPPLRKRWRRCKRSSVGSGRLLCDILLPLQQTGHLVSMKPPVPDPPRARLGKMLVTARSPLAIFWLLHTPQVPVPGPPPVSVRRAAQYDGVFRQTPNSREWPIVRYGLFWSCRATVRVMNRVFSKSVWLLYLALSAGLQLAVHRLTPLVVASGRRTASAESHNHRHCQVLNILSAAATVGHGTSTPLSGSTRGPSTQRPSRASAAATA